MLVAEVAIGDVAGRDGIEARELKTLCVCVCVFVFECIVYVCMHVCICVCVKICMYTGSCVHAYRHACTCV